jgi:ankyrin repeat protein
MSFFCFLPHCNPCSPAHCTTLPSLYAPCHCPSHRYVASFNGYSRTVDALLRNGADPNAPAPGDMSTPLMAASREGHLRVVGMLLTAGATVDAATAAGYRRFTALCHAAEAGHPEVVNVLCSFGANVEHEAVGNSRPLFIALGAGVDDVTLALIRNGANVRMRGPEGATALYLAVAAGRTRVIEAMLARGADGNQYNA